MRLREAVEFIFAWVNRFEDHALYYEWDEQIRDDEIISTFLEKHPIYTEIYDVEKNPPTITNILGLLSDAIDEECPR